MFHGSKFTFAKCRIGRGGIGTSHASGDAANRRSVLGTDFLEALGRSSVLDRSIRCKAGAPRCCRDRISRRRIRPSYFPGGSITEERLDAAAGVPIGLPEIDLRR